MELLLIKASISLDYNLGLVWRSRLSEVTFNQRLVYRFIDLYPCSRPCVMLSHGQQIETGETALDLGGSQLA